MPHWRPSTAGHSKGSILNAFIALANTRRAIGVIGGAVAGIVLIPVLAPLLSIFGFSAAGPVAGEFSFLPELR